VRTMVVSCALLLVLPAGAPVDAGQPPLQVVAAVDYVRYGGTWYEIARLPNRFQRQCEGDVTARYVLRGDGRIDVVNRCRTSGGAVSEASGVARRAEGMPPSVLEVRFAPAILSFLPMVWGDYQIIALGADYEYAVVGSPSREYLWILARRPVMDAEVYHTLAEGARAQGFDVSRLIATAHSGSPRPATWTTMDAMPEAPTPANPSEATSGIAAHALGVSVKTRS
jgi:apolipoprotein D and lipocalin family protein